MTLNMNWNLMAREWNGEDKRTPEEILRQQGVEPGSKRWKKLLRKLKRKK